jgi:hypothetical protein
MLVFRKLSALLLSVSQERLKSTDIEHCYSAVIPELFCGTLQMVLRCNLGKPCKN